MTRTPITTLISSVVKKRFSILFDPFTLQTRTLLTTEKFVGVRHAAVPRREGS
jgi:hypothetical protein